VVNHEEEDEVKKKMISLWKKEGKAWEGVGDSPRGPLKQWGKPHLKPATKPKYVKPNHAGT
jgi:hypothetical protein